MAVPLQNEAIYGSSVGTWLEEPEEGHALQLSTFGQVHSTLESFVTDRAIAFCAGQTVSQAPLQDARHPQVSKRFRLLSTYTLGFRLPNTLQF